MKNYRNNYDYNRDRKYNKDFDPNNSSCFFDNDQELVDIYSEARGSRSNQVGRAGSSRREYENRRTCRRRPDREPKDSSTSVIVSAIAFALVAVVAAGALAIGALNIKPVSGNTDPTMSISASVDKDANKAAQNNNQPAEQTAVKSDDSSSAQQSEDRIDTVNGERIYIDTKRQAPDNTGTPAHFYANGKTSYGFDWTYDADNNNFVIRCDYNFDEQQYDFQFYGTAPGTANITVWYNTDDNTQVPVNLTLNVDDSLNAALV